MISIWKMKVLLIDISSDREASSVRSKDIYNEVLIFIIFVINLQFSWWTSFFFSFRVFHLRPSILCIKFHV